MYFEPGITTKKSFTSSLPFVDSLRIRSNSDIKVATVTTTETKANAKGNNMDTTPTPTTATAAANVTFNVLSIGAGNNNIHNFSSYDDLESQTGDRIGVIAEEEEEETEEKEIETGILQLRT